MARKLTGWGLALAVSAGIWFGVWRGCDAVFSAGEMAGRYAAESELMPALHECRERLSVEQTMSEACDNQLFDCTASLRFTELRPTSEAGMDTGSRGHPL